ncbi:MAG: sulfatase [Anaerolineae bacterium]
MHGKPICGTITPLSATPTGVSASALRLLEQAGHAEDTVVVYVSDHGDMGYEHGLTGKCVFYEPSVRVPLLMRCPGQIAPGWRHDGLVELVDLFPTLCEAACVDTPAGLAGRSLWPEVRAKQSIGKDAVFSESYPMERNRALFGPRPHRMVLTGPLEAGRVWRYRCGPL